MCRDRDVRRDVQRVELDELYVSGRGEDVRARRLFRQYRGRCDGVRRGGSVHYRDECRLRCI